MRGAALVAGGVLLGGAVDVLSPRHALAAEKPQVYDREEWGARSPRQRPEVLSRRPDHIVVHHTATGNSTNYSRSHAFSLAKGIQNWHMDNNGWWDVGQQLTISRGGYIMEGRWGALKVIKDGKHVVGAHTANHNSHTIGIENEGTYTSANPPERLMGALVDTIAWLCTVYGLDPRDAIVGHRDFNATACPGNRLYAMLPQLRRDVRDRQARLEQRLERRGYSEVPREYQPTYPEVPVAERTAQFYHGPALGTGDRNAG